MFDQMGDMMEMMQELQGENLQISALDVVTMEKEQGVILQLTSPDVDGAKLAKLLGKVMAKFPDMIKSQNPKIKVSYRNIPLAE